MRPVANYSENLLINIGFSVQQLIEISEKSQSSNNNMNFILIDSKYYSILFIFSGFVWLARNELE